VLAELEQDGSSAIAGPIGPIAFDQEGQFVDDFTT
jgi:hypothetical protein